MIFPTHIVAAGAMVTNEKDEVLLVKNPIRGWEFPGGKIEEWETPQEALKREILEELDTEISVGELIDTIEYDYPTFHLSMDCFWCEVVKGDLVLKEHEAARWLDEESLDEVEWLPADVTLIRVIKKICNKREGKAT